METAGAPVEQIDLRELERRAPGLDIDRPLVLYEPESGVLAADRCLRALEESAVGAGAQIRKHSRVVSVNDRDDGVDLVVASGEDRSETRASVVVVCAGHWTAPLLAQSGIKLELVSTLEQAVHLSPIAGKASEVPVFIERESPWVYGLPVATPGLLKVALHHAGPVADPDGSPLDPDPHLLSLIADHTARLLPGYHPQPVSSERCFYDTTADEDFVLDRIGRIVVGAGTSGHGFKFGPLLGELLADLALDAGPRFDLSRFSARRRTVANG
jgi:sarcosine oxidase